jgi:hypothetical protein
VGLLPDDADARARAITWVFAAFNTVEPPILELATAKVLEGDKPWTKERPPLVEDRVRDWLKQLSARWLDDRRYSSKALRNAGNTPASVASERAPPECELGELAVLESEIVLAAAVFG